METNLDRNVNPDGRCKYALINTRKLKAYLAVDADAQVVSDAISILEAKGLIKYGNETPQDQFFVLRYADKLVPHALSAYSNAAFDVGMMEYSRAIDNEVTKAKKAGVKLPD